MSDQTLEQKIAAESAMLHAVALREKLRTAEARVRELEANEQAWMAKESTITAENLRLSRRVKELEEAMPDPITLRQMAEILQRYGCIGLCEALNRMATGIEKVVNRGHHV